MTRAEQIRTRVDELMAAGTERAAAFTQVATELGIKPASVRGAYYTAVNGGRGEGTSRPPAPGDNA